jgi:DNA-binding NarL/FixJ family response regulator
MACAQAERWMFDGEVDRILAVLASARELHTTGQTDAAFEASRYRLTQSTVGALGLNGRVAEMTTEYRLHLQLAIDHGLAHPLAREVVDPWWVSGNLTAGHLDTVVGVMSDRYTTALAVDDGLSRPLWALPKAIERWMAGDLVAAEHFAREAMGVPAEVVSIRRMATHCLARILELAGRYDEALEHAHATSGDDYVGIVRSWGAGIEYRCQRASGAVLLPSDQRRLAARVRDTIDGAIERGQLITAAYVAHDVVGYDHGIDVAATLNELAARTDAPSIRWMSAHATVLAGDGVDVLLDAVHESDAAGCHGLSTRLASAALDVAVQRRDAPAAAVADALVQHCRSETTGFAQTVRPPGVFDAFGLSGREREIARAATAGLTDHEIAAELYISVRTVNAHLRTIYRKLGISSRRDLPVD